MTLALLVPALLLSAPTVSASDTTAPSAKTTYKDFEGTPSNEEDNGSQAPVLTPGAPALVTPSEAPQGAPAMSTLRTEIPKTAVQPGQVITPRLITPEMKQNRSSIPNLAASRAANDGWSHNYCNHIPLASASPAPPASGQSWAVGRASMAFGWEIARASRFGFDPFNTTTSANLNFQIPLYLPPSWPQPARMQAWAEPDMEGVIALNAGVSPAGVASGSNGRFVADIGWTIGSQNFMSNMWNISEETAGYEKVKYAAYSTPAGQAFTWDVGVQPGATHTFQGTSSVTSSATSTYGAGAFAQTDFGGSNIDVPNAYGRGHYYFDKKGYNLVDYKLPPGYTVACS